MHEQAQSETLPAGRRLPVIDGRFEVRRRLGRGSSKDVYLAHDLRLDRDVALSFVPSGYPGTATRERLDREARLLALLDEHPNIVTIHDLGESGGTPYVVARYMDGGSLAERLKATPGHRLDVTEAVRVAASVAAALAHAHARGVVHRDVKPSNIWFDAHGRAAVGDFGVALAPGEPRLTVGGGLVGTPGYMAPEQITGGTGDARSDLYSLGVTLYETLCGAPPFTGDTPDAVLARQVEADPLPPSQANRAIAAPLERLVMALLATVPTARPDSAAALQAALRATDPDAALSRRPIASLANAVPAPPTRTVGREELTRRVETELGNPTTRLLTLTGPGGVGKTRLAIDVARVRSGRFVGLAPVSSSDQIAAAVCDALAVARIPEETADAALLRALAREQTLLVLDNLEHLLDGAPFIAELLEQAPGVTILATSREPLRVYAERVLPVPPLELPEDDGPSSTEASAVALFTQTARARDPGFALTDQTLPPVVEVCRQLDGLPLAIELAAARLGVLDVAALAGRMRDAVTLLTSGPRDAPARQRTLRATLDWSLELLDPDERAAFTALGAFVGGCDLDAAGAVTSQPLEVLEALVAKSLAIAEAGRLRLLEPIRQYAAALLALRPDAHDVRARHFRHYLAAAEEAEPDIEARAASAPTFARLHRDEENLQAALAWALDAGVPSEALRLLGALGAFWQVHESREAERRRWCERAITAVGADADPRLLARAYVTWAFTWRWTTYGMDHLAHAIELFRRTDDRWGTARCLVEASVWQSERDDLDAARRSAEEALQIANELGDDWLVGRAYSAIAAATGDIATALPLVHEATIRLRRTGALTRLAGFLSGIGFYALREDEYELADTFQSEALEAARTVDVPYLHALIHGNRGLAAILAGRETEAAAAFLEELEIAERHALITFYFEAFLGLAAFAAARGDLRRAAALDAAAWHHNDRPVTAAEQPVYDRLIERFLDPARRDLGPAEWDRAAADGRGLRLEAAVELARAAGDAA